MRVPILVVSETDSSVMPRCSRCLRSFSPNSPTSAPARAAPAAARSPVAESELDNHRLRRGWTLEARDFRHELRGFGDEALRAGIAEDWRGVNGEDHRLGREEALNREVR